jgi:adenine phosphoribosyltransferase
LFSVKYGLEYGSDELEMAHISTHDKGTCVIVDDVLATGGTIDAGERLCKLHGLEVKDKICFMDIGIYNGYDIKSIVQYVNR